MADISFTLDGLTYNIFDDGPNGLTAAQARQIIENMHTNHVYQTIAQEMAASSNSDHHTIRVYLDLAGQTESGLYLNSIDGYRINLAQAQLDQGQVYKIKDSGLMWSGDAAQYTADQIFIHEFAHLHNRYINGVSTNDEPYATAKENEFLRSVGLPERDYAYSDGIFQALHSSGYYDGDPINNSGANVLHEVIYQRGLSNLDLSTPTALTASVLSLIAQSETTYPDPLVLDLNGNNSIDLNVEHTVYFDTDSDGFAEAVNWVAATDGLLARDVNENGTIDNNMELFGSATEDGFSVLRAFDLNTDGVINATDDIWADLVVWQDVNQDGYSQSSELLTLTSLGISSIDLDSVVNTNEASVTHNGTVSTTTGTMKISNVLFDADFTNTRYVGDYTLDIDTLFLPTLRGHGTVADLHIAASMDTSTDANGDTIKDKLLELASLSLIDIVNDLDSVKEVVRTLLYHWAGVEDAASNSRGPHIDDARQLLFLEKYLHEHFVSTFNGSFNPGVLQAGFIDSAFNELLSKFTGEILVQAGAGELFESAPYDFAADGINPAEFVLSEDTLEILADHASGLANTAARMEFWKNFVDVVHVGAYTIKNTGSLNAIGLTTAEEDKLNAAIEESDATLTWYQENHGVGGALSVEHGYYSISGIEYIAGNSGETYTGSVLEDRILGGNGVDTLDGGDGNDLILGANSDDEIHGGAGNDTIYGDDNSVLWIIGNDVIYAGDGNDVVYASVGSDEIYGGDGNDTLWGDLLDGREGSYGVGQEDTIDGGLGNDRLVGGAGDDLLIDGYGSTGQNLLEGGLGVNTYRVVGGGAEVYISTGLNGVLEVPAAYTDEDDLVFDRVADFLHIVGSISGSEIDVYIADQFSGWLTVDLIRFASSYEYNLGYLVATMLGQATEFDDVMVSTDTSPSNTHVDTIYALGGNDTIYGDGGDDLLYGDDGDDTLYGESGSDTLSGGNGDDNLHGGNDLNYLYGGAGNDVLTGGTWNDYSYGGAGNDTYIFDGSWRFDYVNEEVGEGFDTLVFDDIASTGTMYLTTSSGHLWIWQGADVVTAYASTTGYAGTTNETTIGTRIEALIFSDSVTVTLNEGLLLTGTVDGEGVWGSQFADTINGMEGGDSIYGNRGNDTVHGDDGNDIIYGGDGNDILHGDDGYDQIYGEAGHDTIYGDAIGDSLYGGDGNDTIYGGAGYDWLLGDAGNDTLDAGEDFDEMWGGAGDDTYITASTYGNDVFIEYDNEGYDTIFLSDILPTNVRLWATSTGLLEIITGSVTLTISASTTGYGTYETGALGKFEEISFYNSTVWDLSEGFTLTGTGGNDIGYGSAGDDVIYGLAGYDQIYGNRGNDTIHGGDTGDSLYGGAGNDTIYGGDGYDWTIGGDGDDILHGEGDFDEMWGDNDNDTLYGGDVGDILYGGAGNDILHGEAGADSLYGDSGADIFVFAAATAFGASDTIMDFSTGSNDKIDISDLLAAYDPLTHLITDFVEITTSGSDSILKVDSDGGGNSFIQVATISGVTGLTDEAALVTSGHLIAA